MREFSSKSLIDTRRWSVNNRYAGSRRTVVHLLPPVLPGHACFLDTRRPGRHRGQPGLRNAASDRGVAWEACGLLWLVGQAIGGVSAAADLHIGLAAHEVAIERALGPLAGTHVGQDHG